MDINQLKDEAEVLEKKLSTSMSEIKALNESIDHLHKYFEKKIYNCSIEILEDIHKELDNAKRKLNEELKHVESKIKDIEKKIKSFKNKLKPKAKKTKKPPKPPIEVTEEFIIELKRERSKLKKMTNADLKAICNYYKTITKGTKPELINRIERQFNFDSTTTD